MRFRLPLNACLCVVSALASGRAAQAQLDFERPPINYQQAPSGDAIAQLHEALVAGKAALNWDDRHGWLPGILETLDIPQESQTLVFSKTSLQIRRISPERPRALYFNDDIYVGWVQGGDVLELSAVDADLGAVFYTLVQQQAERPRIVRDRGECLSCHASARTKGVPGYLVRSVYAAADGRPHFGLGTLTTDHTTPFEHRFGGWYVTGSHGSMRHRGNVLARDDPDQPIDPERGANLARLPERVDAERYLQPGSDLVALMILEHQTQMHNLITRATYETRQALHYQEVMNRAFERPPGTRSESTTRRIAGAGEQLLRGLLLVDQLALDSPVKGSSGFAARFSARGPRDGRGRSLRELDLKTRLFRYPCSYLIHSDSFRRMPAEIRDYVETRLRDILTGSRDAEVPREIRTQFTDEDFAPLTAADRTAVWEILQATREKAERQQAPGEKVPGDQGAGE